MKARKAKDLRELSTEELEKILSDAQETLMQQKFQHSLKQLQDTAYLKILRKDIARMKTIIHERQING
ncbi:MAG: 50S ribosomal protein L29 [Ignavibacteria bacterium]|jgi:large subunit ribosomal protein L29|nr:50S ribosomal protein L29 [Ignavibacteria bacterium]